MDIPCTTCLHIPLAHPCLINNNISPQYTVLYTVLHIAFYCTFLSLFFLIILFYSTCIYVYSLVLCYIFCTVHGVDLTHISLLIIFFIIEYVTNKTLNPFKQTFMCHAL